MATATPSAPGASGPKSGKFIEYDRFIEQQLAKTRGQVRTVDIASSLLLLATGTLVYFLVAALIDHWVMRTGLGFWGRLFFFAVYLIGAVGFVAREIVPLLVRRINPVYAAATIEHSKPTLKNSLVNLLLFRSGGKPLPPALLEAMEQQAATTLAHLPAESAVDQSRLIKIGYVGLAALAICAIYKVASPKDPFTTVRRVMMPWGEISAPSRVSIADVQPGSAKAFRGEPVVVSAEVHGLSGSPVTLYYSTADGQLVDQAVEMRVPASDYRYSASIPPGNDGLQQRLTYRIEAGDARTVNYSIDVQAAPTIVIESVGYRYPAYTKLLDKTVDNQGDIRGIEGTEITIHAQANHEIGEAHIDFNCDGRDDLPMTVNGMQAQATFTLALEKDRHSPQYASYQLHFKNLEGHGNKQPTQYTIDVTPDVAPEVSIVQPKRERVQLTVGGLTTIQVQASDPDFALRRVALQATVAKKPIPIAPLLNEEHAGQFLGKHPLDVRKLSLKAGDVVEYWAVAEDNKSPSANKVETPHQFITIVDPAAQQPQQGKGSSEENVDERAKPDRNRQQPDKDNQGKNTPEEQQPDAGKKNDQTNKNDPQQPPEKEPGKQAKPNPNQKNPPGENGNNKKPDNQPGQRADKPARDNQDQTKPGDNQPNAGNDEQPGEQQPDQQPQDGAAQNDGNAGGGQPNAGNDQPDPQQGNDPQGKDQQNGADNQAGGNQNGGADQPENQRQDNQPGGKDGAQQPAGGKNNPAGQQNGAQHNGGQKNVGQKNGDQPAPQRDQPVAKDGADDGNAIEKILQHQQKQEAEKPKNQGNQGNNPPGDKPRQAGDQPQQNAGQGNRNQAPDRQEREDAQQPQPGDQAGAGKNEQAKPPGKNQDAKNPGDKNQDAKNPGAQNPGDQPPGAQQQPGQGDNARAERNDKADGADDQSQPMPGAAAGGEKEDAPGQKGERRQKPDQGANPADQKPTRAQPQDGAPQPGQNGADQQPGDQANAEKSPMEQDGAAKNDQAKNDQGKPQQKPNPQDAQQQRPGDGAGARGKKEQPSPSNSGQSKNDQSKSQPKASPDHEKGDSGGAQPSKNPDGSPSPQEANKHREKSDNENGKQPEQGKPRDAQSPSNSKRQSDSKGQQDGDRSGGGGKGGGQNGNAAGTGDSGTNTEAEQGAGKAQQRGDGETGDNAGADEQADGKTGQAGNQKGGGSGTRPGNNKSQPGDEPGDNHSQQGDQRDPDAATGGKNGANPGPGGSGTPAGGRPNAGNNSAVQQKGETSAGGADDANLDYARKATDLAIQHLRDEMKNDRPDQELLDKLGWSKEDLRSFLDRWETMKRDAKMPGEKGEEAKRELDETLRSLGVRPRSSAVRSSDARNDQSHGLKESRRTPPPADYAEQLKAYTRKAAKGRSN